MLVAMVAVAVLPVWQPFSGEIQRGQVREHRFAAEENACYEIRLHQRNIDTGFEIAAPGEPAILIEHGEFGVERGIVHTSRAGEVVVRVIAWPDSSRQGRYRLEIIPIAHRATIDLIGPVENRLSRVVRDELRRTTVEFLRELSQQAHATGWEYLGGVADQELSRHLHRRRQLEEALGFEKRLISFWSAQGDAGRQFTSAREQYRLLGRMSTTTGQRAARSLVRRLAAQSPDARIQLAGLRTGMDRLSGPTRAEAARLERIYQLQAKAGFDQDSMSTLAELAVRYVGLGDSAAAEQTRRRLGERLPEFGTPRDRVTFAELSGKIHFLVGRYEEAMAEFVTAAELARAAGDERWSFYLINQADCLLHLERYEEALAAIEAAERRLPAQIRREAISGLNLGWRDYSLVRNAVLLQMERMDPTKGFARRAVAEADAERSGDFSESAREVVRNASTLLEDDEAIVCYMHTTLGLSAAYVIARGRERFVDLGPPEALPNVEKEVRLFGLNRLARERFIKEAGDRLLRPLRLEPGVKRLIIVPGSTLERIPWAAVPDPRNPGRLLCETAVVMLAPSILEAVKVVRRDRREARQLAVVYDPVFGPADSRYKGRKAQAADPIVHQAMRAAGLRGDEPQRLPYTRREASAIMKHASDAYGITGYRATKQAVLSGELRNFRVVHFATHGVGSTLSWQQVGLFLTMMDETGKRIPGFLTYDEITSMKLRADLVVLSACQTTVSSTFDPYSGHSTALAFLRAGARHVVSSLWQVDDEATAELMGHFYGYLLGRGEPAENALRLAQLRMKKSARWSAPYYWAGFTILGSWR